MSHAVLQTWTGWYPFKISHRNEKPQNKTGMLKHPGTRPEEQGRDTRGSIVVQISPTCNKTLLSPKPGSFGHDRTIIDFTIGSAKQATIVVDDIEITARSIGPAQ